MHLMRPVFSCIGLISLFALVSAPIPTHAQTVVVPGANADVEGDTDNSFPFGIGLPFSGPPLSTMRYQQIYGATAFIGLGPITIKDIAFRLDASASQSFEPTSMNIQIDLSTTLAAVDGLDTTFSRNLGGDLATVYSGSLTLGTTDIQPMGDTRDFDIVLELQSPFTYDPLAGSLLLDVRQFTSASTPFFDAAFTNTDETSRVLAYNVYDNIALGADTVGLVTQFRYEAVAASAPEPCPLALLAL